MTETGYTDATLPKRHSLHREVRRSAHKIEHDKIPDGALTVALQQLVLDYIAAATRPLGSWKLNDPVCDMWGPSPHSEWYLTSSDTSQAKGQK